MDTSKHLVVSLTLSAIIVVTGTMGYMVIEGWDFLDALYMTVITISTVGFMEVQPMGDMGHLFTICLVFIGVGFTLYVAAAVVQFMVEGRIRIIMGRRRVDRKISHLSDHYIVCGYGRIGKVLCKKIGRGPTDILVLEQDEDLIPQMDEDKILYICGDASDEEILVKAGIAKARGLISVLATDTDNVFLVLTARQLAPDLNIMVRASRDSAKKKLMAAGATSVESPYEMGALRMAQKILRPTVTSFLDLAFAHSRKEIQMEETRVNHGSDLANVMLKDSGIRQRFNLILIAISLANGEMLFNPSFEYIIKPGDTVIAVGEKENLQQLEKILSP
ncbi:MAG: potassium channel protein [Deltaproteobacteria bacterium]|nr:potassium channel protein [Deltaproteobacteria bacterium]